MPCRHVQLPPAQLSCSRAVPHNATPEFCGSLVHPELRVPMALPSSSSTVCRFVAEGLSARPELRLHGRPQLRSTTASSRSSSSSSFPTQAGGRVSWVFGGRLSVHGTEENPECRTIFEICGQGSSKMRTRAASGGQQPTVERKSGFRCLSKITTAYNRIVILEAPESSPSVYAGCRVLLLDHSRNVQSIYKRQSVWTNFYWDEFASLPAIIPAGPVAIIGLGGGTAARILLDLWPSLRVDGFEIDETVVEEARRLLGLSELELPNPEGGCLAVHIADAFSPASVVDGEFAGIIVDIFSEGEVAYELQQSETWLKFGRMLMPGGRIMVNCGGECVEKSDPKAAVDDGTWTWQDGQSSGDALLRAMALAFNKQVSWRETSSRDLNCLALSGPLPDLESWAAAVPEQLRAGVACWRPYR